MSAMRAFSACVLAAALGGCGLFTPEMQTFWETKDLEKRFENIIVNNVKCEIRNGVYEAKRLLRARVPFQGNDITWLEQQGALVTLKLAVDEKSALNPGISYANFAPNPFSFGVGTANSTDATRTEIVAFTYSFHDLLHERGVERYLGVPCDHEDGVLIQSDLKIKEFIVNKVFLAKVPGSVVIEDVPGGRTVPNNPFSTFQYEVNFVIAVWRKRYADLEIYEAYGQSVVAPVQHFPAADAGPADSNLQNGARYEDWASDAIVRSDCLPQRRPNWSGGCHRYPKSSALRR